jgi:hypothetical protein
VKNLNLILLTLLAPLALLLDIAEAGEVSGERRIWHAVEVRFAGPVSSEADNSPNPFLDRRLQCRFTAPSGRVLDVPGFFDGDGASGSGGSVWACRLSPDEVGSWSYVASFRTGAGVAVSLDPNAGSATSFNGESGVFDVQPSDKVGRDFRSADKGRLAAAGGHYLQFLGSGDPWLKGGTNIPENLLAYVGFDNTPDAGHTFSVHGGDWRSGDPDWGTRDGRAIIGALNYLSDVGANNIYFLPANVGGDGDDTYPTLGPQDRVHYDTSKLRQWEIVFSHADAVGIFLHFQLAEFETVNYHDNGNLGNERKLFYREMIARFGHHLGVEWDLGEENTYTTAKREQFAAYIRDVDPYDHPVTTHTQFDAMEQVYAPLLGNSDFSMTSFQPSIAGIGPIVADWRQRSANAGAPWVISVDEPQSIENDLDDQTRGYPHGRRNFVWPVYLSGGGGVEWYVQEDGGGHTFDQRIDDFRPLAQALLWTQYARTFLAGLPLLQMAPQPGASTADYTFTLPGVVYALYVASGRSLSVDLSASTDDFEVRWFDPQVGAWHIGATVSGGGNRSIGAPPFGGDAAVLVRNVNAGAFGSCDIVPATGCRTARKQAIGIVRKGGKGNRLVWKWIGGDATPFADFADPQSTSVYRVCVYDERSAGSVLTMELTFPAGTGWETAGPKGYKYRDGDRLFDGLQRGLLRSGPTDKSKIVVKAKGERVPTPVPVDSERLFAQNTSVTVQLEKDDGTCWTAFYPQVSTKKNTPESFTAKAR